MKNIYSMVLSCWTCFPLIELNCYLIRLRDIFVQFSSQFQKNRCKIISHCKQSFFISGHYPYHYFSEIRPPGWAIIIFYMYKQFLYALPPQAAWSVIVTSVNLLRNARWQVPSFRPEGEISSRLKAEISRYRSKWQHKLPQPSRMREGVLSAYHLSLPGCERGYRVNSSFVE